MHEYGEVTGGAGHGRHQHPRYEHAVVDERPVRHQISFVFFFFVVVISVGIAPTCIAAGARHGRHASAIATADFPSTLRSTRSSAGNASGSPSARIAT